MKNLTFLVLFLIALVACKQKNESIIEAVDSHQIGINYDSTANMDVIKSTFNFMESFDSSSYRTKYVDTAKFHDNGKVMSLDENIRGIAQFASIGVKFKVKDDYVMWGSHFNFKDGSQGDYVYTYHTITFSKENKSVDIVFFQGDSFNKDGKIIEEWLVYDSSKIASLMM